MFKTSDGIQIDIRENFVVGHRALIVLWPCMTGNTAMYKLPVAIFNNAGISVIQFNPRGHSRSEGQFDLNLCLRDLHEYLSSLNIVNVPLWFIGHSAGASALLKYGTSYSSAHWYILISPVLDSIESYRYLYENGNQKEANTIIASLTSGNGFILSILENNHWMNREVWETNSYREKFDAESVKLLIGTFMQKLFIEGFNAFNDLKLHSARTSMLLPVTDNWFPMSVTTGLATQNGIKTETITEATGHYFTGAWKYVWNRVMEMMNP